MATYTQVFSDLEIFPDYYDGFTYSWELIPKFNEPRPWNFIVQESTDQGNTWSDISDSLENIAVYSDDMRRRYSKDNLLIFRVQLTDGNGVVYHSFSIAPYAQLDLGTSNPKREYLIAREIMRKETLMMRVSSGVPVELWRRDPFKRLDLTETDPYTGIILNPDTESSVVYYGPYNTEAVFSPSKRDKEQDPSGIGYTERYAYNVRLLGFPYVNDKDVIIDRVQDRRYYIDGVTNVAEIRRFPLVQSVIAKEAPKSDLIYKLGN